MMLTLITTVGTSSYLIASKPVATWPTPPLAKGDLNERLEQTPLPSTIIDVSGVVDLISSSWLQRTVDEMLARDDVFCVDFLSSIFFLYSTEGTPPALGYDAKVLLKSWGSFAACQRNPGTQIPPPSGPYFLLNWKVHQIFKLYPDPYGAFMYGVVQSEEDPTSYERVLTNLIPVPSRLYSTPPNDSKPLSGKRLAIKDIYDIRGLKTSMGCRSYEACYSECDQTAVTIRTLIKLGAVIVAKAKTVQLASGLGPRDWIDYQCPFNPRGDEYLSPDCSSTGSAVGVAAYDWLDFSIGSDSLGSMVGPAAANGVFGLRPTHGVLPLEGSLLVSTLLDTPGHFSRDICDFSTFASAWFGLQQPTSTIRFTLKILFPADRFTPYAQAKLDVMESFIRDLEKLTGVQRTALNIDSLWKEAAFSHESESINDFLATTLAHIQLYDCYHNNARFRGEYEAEFGFSPYVEPMIQYKWRLGAKLSRQDYAQACNEKAIFGKFLKDFVINERAVMLLPGGDPETSYRDEYIGSPDEFGRKFQGFSFKDTAYSVLGGLPCVSFPVGQSSYRSKITNKEEFEPVSLMLLGPPGSDLTLIDLIKQVFESSGRPLSVKVGKTAF